MKILNVYGREILDSRGNPTVEAEITLANGIIATASVPSGASTGSREALELRDGDNNRYHGKGVTKAVNNINTTIRKALIGLDINQVLVDKTLLSLDNTVNKSIMGANAMLAVSLASVKALAKLEGKELYEYLSTGKVTMPVPMMNIFNGGKHASSNIDIQEFMIVPVVNSFKERLRAGSEIFHTLKKILTEQGLNTAVGDEGGFAPSLSYNSLALDLIVEAIKKSGYVPGKDVYIALDIAASELYDKNTSTYKIDSKMLSSDELIKYQCPIKPLQQKINDLGTLLQNYNEAKSGILDNSDTLALTCIMLDKSDVVKNTYYIFVGFDDFTSQGYLLIEKLLKYSKGVYVNA